VSPLTTAAAALGVLATGYALGRLRPARRFSDWANWHKYDQSLSRHSARWWTVWTVLAVEDLAWVVGHPATAWQAWQHRNDPPPARGPALTFNQPASRDTEVKNS
jgi:membrane protein YqaA with SNARE-associated domain